VIVWYDNAIYSYDAASSSNNISSFSNMYKIRLIWSVVLAVVNLGLLIYTIFNSFAYSNTANSIRLVVYIFTLYLLAASCTLIWYAKVVLEMQSVPHL